MWRGLNLFFTKVIIAPQFAEWEPFPEIHSFQPLGKADSDSKFDFWDVPMFVELAGVVILTIKSKICIHRCNRTTVYVIPGLGKQITPLSFCKPANLLAV
jgi:hypothetical protein